MHMRHANIYMPHMRSLVSNMQLGVMYIYLANITEQIWLPHSKYSSHSQHAMWTYRPNILHLHVKIQPTATFISQVIAKYLPETYMHHKLDIYAIYAKYFICIYEQQ